MWKVILRRILLMIPELVILSLLVFLLAKLMPGDPFTGMVTPQTAPEQIEALRVQSGFITKKPNSQKIKNKGGDRISNERIDHDPFV